MDSETSDDSGPIYLNRAQLARAMGVTPPTIDNWIADGMPVAEKGSNGRAYKFDLLACQSWRAGEEHRTAEEKRRQENLVRNQQLDLVGGDLGGSEMAMSPAKRRELWDEQAAWMRVAKERRELVPRAEVRERYEEAFKFLGHALQGLPDVLSRRCGLSPEALVEVQRTVDAWQADLARTMETEDKLDLARVA